MTTQHLSPLTMLLSRHTRRRGIPAMAAAPFVPRESGDPDFRAAGKQENSWGSWRQLVGKIFPAWIKSLDQL